MTKWIIIKFTKHEIWALKWAQKLPFFASFFFASLWVWFIIPVLAIVPVIPLLIVFNKEWPVAFSIVSAPFVILSVIPFFLFVMPWYFRWGFICFGLEFGRTKMANNKMEELKRRLVKLTASE